jgi:hypothetical protein
MRAANYDREVSRWDQYEQQVAREEARVAGLQEAPVAWTNQTGLPYNAINQGYAKGGEGKALEQYDASVRERAAVRERAIAAKQHSVDFDIITGQPRR